MTRESPTLPGNQQTRGTGTKTRFPSRPQQGTISHHHPDLSLPGLSSLTYQFLTLASDDTHRPMKTQNIIFQKFFSHAVFCIILYQKGTHLCSQCQTRRPACLPTPGLGLWLAWALQGWVLLAFSELNCPGLVSTGPP